ncbi:hypothetical protein [Streptomyces sp. NA02950]|uniref:hypothetical protein n=1 Tax=Streptomyces sp. NA02950 TaxID=2742137 RepID=UPI0020CAE991|nr:hypothetical protein [Streptomyces sp. NA02950]
MAMQQSEEASTRSGIRALEQAYTGVLRCQQDVQGTRHNLASGYQGTDGGGYGTLLDLWDGHVDTILVNLDNMITELNNTLAQHNLVQGSSTEAIDNAYNKSSDVFHTLNPDKRHYVLQQMPSGQEGAFYPTREPLVPASPLADAHVTVLAREPAPDTTEPVHRSPLADAHVTVLAREPAPGHD